MVVNHVRRYSKAALLEVVGNSGLRYQNIWSTLVYLPPTVMLTGRTSKGSSLEGINSLINFLLFQIYRIELFLPKSRMKVPLFGLMESNNVKFDSNQFLSHH